MRYEKYIIGKLFTSQNGDTDIKKEDITGTGVPVITSGVDKDGVLGNTDVEARIIKANTITIDMFGNAFFRPFEYKMVTHARVFSMELIEKEMNEAIGLFLVAQFHWLPKAYNYSNMCSYAKIKNLTITLPTLDELDENSPYSEEGFVPDFDYMQERIEELEQERIEELEQERIEELEQYLVATGLNDYELTDEDIETLSLSGFGHYEERDSEDAVKVCKETREFTLSNILDVITPTKRFNANAVEITECIGHPYVVRSSTNNGIRGYINEDEKYLNDGNTFSFGQDTATIFWQPEAYFTGDKIKVLKPKFNCNDEIANYVMNRIEIAFSGFSWGSQSFKVSVIENMPISLPIQTDTEGNPIIDTECKYHPDGYIPDWDFMEKYIRAIEKIVIADVVQYKDAMISKTKEVVL